MSALPAARSRFVRNLLLGSSRPRLEQKILEIFLETRQIRYTSDLLDRVSPGQGRAGQSRAGQGRARKAGHDCHQHSMT